jgi:hypothetical protein
MRAEKERAEKEKERAEHENTKLKHQAASSSALALRVLQDPDTALASYFDAAGVCEFWLEPSEELEWKAPWIEYAEVDQAKKETGVIQPHWNKKFIPSLASPVWQLSDTHTGWEKLTQDCLLHLRGRKSELTVGLVIELVGQDETGWPNKGHRGKFVRDLIRVFRRRGDAAVHGVITDLARIVAIQLRSIGPDGTPRLRKTPIMTGPEVERVFRAFASAAPEQLGVAVKGLDFDICPSAGGPTAQTTPDRMLGRGAQACVYLLRTASMPAQYLKHFSGSGPGYHRELESLTLLQGTVGVPTVCGVDEKKHAFTATPVGTLIATERGMAWLQCAAVALTQVLQAAHTKNLVHRDVRPSNIIVSGRGVAHLIDWACSAKGGQQVTSYYGTVHYAAISVLESLVRGTPYTPDPAHDLESLVYTFQDLLQKEPPRILAASRDNIADILAQRKQQASATPALAQLLQQAQSRSYSDLLQVGTWATLVPYAGESVSANVTPSSSFPSSPSPSASTSTSASSAEERKDKEE